VSTGANAGTGWGAAVLLGQSVLSRPELPELLDRTLARIRAASIETVAVLVVEPTPAIETVATRHGARVIVDAAPQRGNAGALRDALERLPGDPLLVINGDTDTSTDIRTLMQMHADRADCTLAVVHVADVSGAGYLRLDPDGRVEVFEGPTERLAVPGWAHSGVTAISRDAVSLLASGVPASMEADLLPTLVLSGWRVWASVSGSGFEDIDRA